MESMLLDKEVVSPAGGAVVVACAGEGEGAVEAYRTAILEENAVGSDRPKGVGVRDMGEALIDVVRRLGRVVDESCDSRQPSRCRPPAISLIYISTLRLI